MEQNKSKAGLRPNLFDCVILVLVLAAAAALVWLVLQPAETAHTTEMDSLIRYTVRLQSWPEGNGSMVQVGDELRDNSRGLKLGEVVEVQVVPSRLQALDQENHRYVQAELEGFEDVLVTVEAYGTVEANNIRPYGRMVVKVGTNAYIRGQGYMGSGPVIALEDTPLEEPVTVPESDVRGDAE